MGIFKFLIEMVASFLPVRTYQEYTRFTKVIAEFSLWPKTEEWLRGPGSKAAIPGSEIEGRYRFSLDAR
jgi:hypothetical protein